MSDSSSPTRPHLLLGVVIHPAALSLISFDTWQCSKKSPECQTRQTMGNGYDEGKRFGLMPLFVGVAGGGRNEEMSVEMR